MNPISAFFVRNIIAVFFFYGLAFFALGLALLLATRRGSQFTFARAIVPLAVFGILHGVHEWIEMFQKIATLSSGYTPALSHELLRLALLVASFAMLAGFGFTLLNRTGQSRTRVWLPALAMIALWAATVGAATVVTQASAGEAIAQADVLARYTLGIPAALLGAWALMTQQRTFREHEMPQFGRDLVWATTALLLYGVVGQLFARATALFPTTVINSGLFLQWFGVPVQLFRGVMAAVLAVFLIRALNAFDIENARRLQAANRARLDAQTTAQEAERQRIARELHDATGQALTAIALGLRGMETHLEMATPNNALLAAQVREIKSFSTNALGELRQIIADLRPPILDDMGLVAALKWYVHGFESRRGIACSFAVEGDPLRLPEEQETILFRIAQEALTNVAKHAAASAVAVTLQFQPSQVRLTVEDNGKGFAAKDQPAGGWGLLGMQERAALLGGQCLVESKPGEGTRVQAVVPQTRRDHDTGQAVVGG